MKHKTLDMYCGCTRGTIPGFDPGRGDSTLSKKKKKKKRKKSGNSVFGGVRVKIDGQ